MTLRAAIGAQFLRFESLHLPLGRDSSARSGVPENAR